MRACIKSELYKFCKNRYLRKLAAALLIYDALVILLQYMTYVFQGTKASGAELLIVQGYDDFILLIAAILAANLVQSEFHTGRIKNIAALGYARETIYFSKFIVCAAILFVSYVISRAVYAGAVTLLWGFDESGIFSVWGLFVFFGLEAAVTLAYASILTALSFWAKSAGIAVAVNLMFILFFPMLLEMLSSLTGYRVDFRFWYVMTQEEKIVTYAPTLKDSMQCLGIAAINILIFYAAGLRHFQRQDL